MRAAVVLIGTAVILLGAPLLGIALAGQAVQPYLEFPPRPQPPAAPAFAWPVFGALAVLIAGALAPFVHRLVNTLRASGASPAAASFPKWGIFSLMLLAAAWVLAWTRLPALESIQPHTFLPLWLAYIGVVNALTVWRKGHSLLTREPARFAALFPLSALFWWFFEYLNRFVANWYYVSISDFSALEYVVFATLAFSTVLPAVASTAEWLLTFSWIDAGFSRWHRVRPAYPRLAASLLLAASTVALVGLGVFGEALYPLVWILPVLVIVSVQALGGYATVLGPVAHGDWRMPVAYAFGALVCGFFWEMWNYGSLAHWEYTIPYVDRFRIFEMPVLGYAGYLPFGIECAAVASLVFPDEAKPRMARPTAR